MLYALKQGPVEQVIIKQAYRDGTPLPKAIQNAPELFLGLEFFYNAFWELSSCRNTGLDMGEIPWTAIDRYAVSSELDEELSNDLHYFIRRMDMEYIKYIEHSRPKK